MLRKFMIMFVLGLAVFATACEPDTTSVQITKSIEDTGDETEDTCEEAKQAANAADTH